MPEIDLELGGKVEFEFLKVEQLVFELVEAEKVDFDFEEGGEVEIEEAVAHLEGWDVDEAGDNVVDGEREVGYIVFAVAGPVFAGDMDLDEVDIVVEADTVAEEPLLEVMCDVEAVAP